MVKINFHGFKKNIILNLHINKLDFFLIFISILESVSLVFIITANERVFTVFKIKLDVIRAIRLLKVIGLLKNGEQLLNGNRPGFKILVYYHFTTFSANFNSKYNFI